MNDTTPQSAATESHKGHATDRAISVVIASAVGAVLGFMIGKFGDNQHRQLAQRSFALLGAAFGGLLSYFAAKGEDVRPYDVSDLPPALQPHPAGLMPAHTGPATQVAQVQREGLAEAREAPSIAR